MSEIWTAREKIVENGEEIILFDVLDEETNETRQERRYTTALPLIFATGGYPAVMGEAILMQKLPWRFRKVGSNIYVDGSSVGNPAHHPISN